MPFQWTHKEILKIHSSIRFSIVLVNEFSIFPYVSTEMDELFSIDRGTVLRSFLILQ